MAFQALLGKRVLLVIGGGIAAYKALELIRLLQKAGAKVRAILTQAGAQFVTPLSVSSLTQDQVYRDLFDLTSEAEMGHIQLSRDADLVVVAPATADLMAKATHGLANDLASTTLLATDKRVLMAPAMNVRMWEHATTQRNLKQLSKDGVLFVGPDAGDMACGEYGPGRMAEPAAILAAIEDCFASESSGVLPASLAPQPLAGRKILITAGPTHEPIDPVRYIANRSSGKQGYAIAAAMSELGAETVLISGPVQLPNPVGVKVVRVETAEEMLKATQKQLPVDVAICAAAVADWKVDRQSDQKLKKSKGAPTQLSLTENPDILKTISHMKKKRPKLVIGFAAETEDVVKHAQEKRARKKCDWIVANDVSPGTGIMGGDHNTVHVITEDNVDDWPSLSKEKVAKKLGEKIAAHFAPSSKAKKDRVESVRV